MLSKKKIFRIKQKIQQISIWLEIDSIEEINELEKKMLRTGSTSIHALHETFWDSKYTKIEDKFGIIWELNAQL
ncbi:glyoxalase/bleomycin resistance protein/dioxygenase [Listeria fleischmannii subsp. fleischmannii LU2006-1]|nr:glyoxalase/bleomycin resistance protein/dioxygenase [Listeria fleischmannii subsp. fleischmannii LU2006-1]